MFRKLFYVAAIALALQASAHAQVTKLRVSTIPIVDTAPLQVALQVSPTMHYVKFAHSVLYRGANIEVVWSHIAMVGILGAAFLALALARFRTMLASVQ